MSRRDPLLIALIMAPREAWRQLVCLTRPRKCQYSNTYGTRSAPVTVLYHPA
jgi:hypothetical protein